jgi:hypothetical protein
MTSKLIPLGFNELLGSAFDVIFQVGHLAFAPLREIQLNCFDYAKRPTPEFTCRKSSVVTFKFSMRATLFPVRCNELFGGTLDVSLQR